MEIHKKKGGKEKLSNNQNQSDLSGIGKDQNTSLEGPGTLSVDLKNKTPVTKIETENNRINTERVNIKTKGNAIQLRTEAGAKESAKFLDFDLR